MVLHELALPAVAGRDTSALFKKKKKKVWEKNTQVLQRGCTDSFKCLFVLSCALALENENVRVEESAALCSGTASVQRRLEGRARRGSAVALLWFSCWV